MHAVPSPQSARAPLAISLALSVMVHVGLAGGIAGVFAARQLLSMLIPSWSAAADERSARDPRTPAALPPLAAAEPENVIWVRPGIDESGADTPVWIGHRDESEHRAFLSSVDQSAMTPEPPGMQGDAPSVVPPSPPTPSSASSEPLSPVETPAPAETSPTSSDPPHPEAPRLESPPAPFPAPPPEPRPSVDPVLPTPPAETAPPPTPVYARTSESPPLPVETPETPDAALVDETEVSPPVPDVPMLGPPAPEHRSSPPPTPESRSTPEAVRPAVVEAAGPPAADGPMTPVPSVPPMPAAKPPAARPPSPRPAGNPGEQSDKEADATSIKQAVDYRLGRVQAGEGIDIKTVKPEFSNFTVLTALPRHPVVEITFTAAGKVKNVRMLQSSGYQDVDEPILNAVWAWTVSGKKLDALARENPTALIKISVRMLL